MVDVLYDAQYLRDRAKEVRSRIEMMKTASIPLKARAVLVDTLEEVARNYEERARRAAIRASKDQSQIQNQPTGGPNHRERKTESGQ